MLLQIDGDQLDDLPARDARRRTGLEAVDRIAAGQHVRDADRVAAAGDVRQVAGMRAGAILEKLLAAIEIGLARRSRRGECQQRADPPARIWLA